MTKLLIDVQNIRKIYDQMSKNPYTALDNISLQIAESDFICIMGPSGSGKTTLLNNISSLDIPSLGKVFIDGEDVQSIKEKKLGEFRYKTLGFIFQNYNLLQSLTIFENIAIPLSMHGIDASKIKDKVETIAKQLQIEHTLDKFPNTCSGGERQRASIARAIVTNPKVVIADEPTGNLDSHNSHEVLTYLKQLNEREKMAIVIVTHDPQIAAYSSKLLYLKDGQIAASIERGGMSQNEYFYEIVKITSNEAQKLFD